MSAQITPNRRVLIAGAKFGELYLNAFVQPQPGLELAGLLATGSARAQQLAHAFGIPLYTAPAQVPDDIDLVCVVVRSTVAGGAGTALARAFLQRGMHVLQEHPLHPDDLAPLQALAVQRHLVYWVNSFYPHTPAGRCWIDRAQRVRRLLDGEAPRFAHLVTSRQLLYSSLDLLLQASGTPTATVECMPDDDPAFHTLRLRLAGNTAILRLQSYLDPGDPDLHSLVMHQLTLGWPAGYLTLEASHGPVLWTPALYDPQHRERCHSLYHAAAGPNGAPLARPTTLTVHPAPADWRQACEIDGPAGVGELLQALRRHLDGEATPAGLDAPHQLALARLWRQVLHCAGPARECSLPAPRWIGEHALLAPSVGGTTT